MTIDGGPTSRPCRRRGRRSGGGGSPHRHPAAGRVIEGRDGGPACVLRDNESVDASCPLDTGAGRNDTLLDAVNTHKVV